MGPVIGPRPPGGPAHLIWTTPSPAGASASSAQIRFGAPTGPPGPKAGSLPIAKALIRARPAPSCGAAWGAAAGLPGFVGAKAKAKGSNDTTAATVLTARPNAKVG